MRELRPSGATSSGVILAAMRENRHPMTRPSRQGVRSRRTAERRQFLRLRLRRRRLVASAGGIERGILVAAQRLARKLNEMMRDKPHGHDCIDLAAAQPATGGAPE